MFTRDWDSSRLLSSVKRPCRHCPKTVSVAGICFETSGGSVQGTVRSHDDSSCDISEIVDSEIANSDVTDSEVAESETEDGKTDNGESDDSKIDDSGIESEVYDSDLDVIGLEHSDFDDMRIENATWSYRIALVDHIESMNTEEVKLV